MARLAGRIIDVAAVRDRVPDFAALLESAEDEEASMRLRRAESIGRPIGSAAFVERLELANGRALQPARRGRRPGGKLVQCHRNPASSR